MSNRIDSSPTNRSTSTGRRPAAFQILAALWLLLHFASSPQPIEAHAYPVETGDSAHLSTALDVRDPLSHVRCEPGYTATLYASGLHSPDGLAFDPDGVLHVAEESARQVSRIEADGTVTAILEGIRSPEGIAFDEAGNLYAVEDRRRGRLLRRSPDGQVTTLAEWLAAPEGVAVGPGPAGEPASTIYVTESNAQFTRRPFEIETGISVLTAPGQMRRVIAHTPTLSRARLAFWSYAGLTWGADGQLYVANELSSQEISHRFVLIPGVLSWTATLLTDDSIFRVDPVTGARELVASGLLAPEGLAFSAGGDYPLYVAEENKGFQSRLSRIERDGLRTTVCGNLRGIEDVVVDDNGDLYVSEDRTGYVIRIQGTGEAPPSRSRPSLPLSLSNVSALRRIWAQVAAFARRIAGLIQEHRDIQHDSGIHALASGAN